MDMRGDRGSRNAVVALKLDDLSERVRGADMKQERRGGIETEDLQHLEFGE